MTNDRQTKNAASEGTSASHCSQARCECRDPRTVWNGTRNQWICDDCGKPANKQFEFAKGCAERGLCPRCINIGEDNDHDIDLFGVCLNCGYANPYNGKDHA